jgi:hypothetical protein
MYNRWADVHIFAATGRPAIAQPKANHSADEDNGD